MGKVTNNVLPTWYNMWCKYVLLLVLLSCGDLFPSHSTHTLTAATRWQILNETGNIFVFMGMGRLRTERQNLKVKSKIHLYTLDYKHPFMVSVIYTGLIFCRYFLYKWQKVVCVCFYTMFCINGCKINSVSVHALQTHQTTLRKSGQNAQQPGHIPPLQMNPIHCLCNIWQCHLSAPPHLPST